MVGWLCSPHRTWVVRPAPKVLAGWVAAHDPYNKLYIGAKHIMDTITYTAARAHLASTMDRVCDDHEPLIITRNGDRAVVMLSLEDYKALEETAYLLRSPANARRLLNAIAQLSAGQGTPRELAE